MMPLRIAYNTTWINNSIPKIIKIIGLFFDIKFIVSETLNQMAKHRKRSVKSL